MSLHQERTNAEFKRVLSEAVRTLKDPRLSPMCSIADVQITKDLKHAKVFVSIYDDAQSREDSIMVLNQASGSLAREVNSRMRMRRIPNMHFVLDDSIEYSVHIGQLIDRINREKGDAQGDGDDHDQE